MLEEVTQKWHPTHVQVTVLEARDLHAKGKHGTNDTYTIIQLGKEKYSTSVLEKSLCPVWKEEASFELPGMLVQDGPEQYQLQLTLLHRSLVGPDRFLGHVTINLNSIYDDRERRKTRWYKLQSKQGKKPKERGEVRVNVQFMRNNMTASMFDLSMKDKTRSPFARLKDKMKGRKSDGSDTSSAIIPSTSHLHQTRDNDGTESRVKTKHKKPFFLGPQRLSSAHSMSDLTPPPSARLGPPGKLDSISSAEEGGSLKSPHRRTMSADTKDKPTKGSGPGMDWTGEGHNDLALAASIPHKFATLPRQWAPNEDHHEAMEGSSTRETSSTSLGLSSKPDGKRDGKKKDKVSLFERVTGKKEGKRSDRHSQDISEWEGARGTPDCATQTQMSTNPFWAASTLPEQRSYITFPSSAGPVTTQLRSNQRAQNNYPYLQGPSDMNPFEGGGAYGHLTRVEVERELSKHKDLLKKKDGHIRELEDYIDNLLVRVMEETPSILRVPYVPSRRAGKFSPS